MLVAGIEIALPYMLRRAPTVASGSVPLRSHSRRARLWPHYWLGYALLGLILLHTSFVMGPAMSRSDAVGIWAATFGLCMILLQVGIGLLLNSGASNQPMLRRCHFSSMIVFVVLLLIHVLRNG